jgi:hypothetical protein
MTTINNVLSTSGMALLPVVVFPPAQANTPQTSKPAAERKDQSSQPAVVTNAEQHTSVRLSKNDIINALLQVEREDDDAWPWGTKWLRPGVPHDQRVQQINSEKFELTSVDAEALAKRFNNNKFLWNGFKTVAKHYDFGINGNGLPTIKDEVVGCSRTFADYLTYLQAAGVVAKETIISSK